MHAEAGQGPDRGGVQDAFDQGLAESAGGNEAQRGIGDEAVFMTRCDRRPTAQLLQATDGGQGSDRSRLLFLFDFNLSITLVVACSDEKLSPRRSTSVLEPAPLPISSGGMSLGELWTLRAQFSSDV